MAQIQVTCPSCHTRFNVSDKFCGQSGPCPKCKKPIKIPEKGEEVVIHAPDEFGPKDAAGRAVLKPIEREETRITPVMIAGMVAAGITILVVAFLVGRHYRGSETGIPMQFLGFGAVLLGPPIAIAGYGIVRDQELEPHRGLALLVRAAICGVLYAGLWAAYLLIKTMLFEGDIELFHLTFVAPAMLAAGGVVPLATLDLDYMSGVLHYGLYLLVTVLLRLLMAMPPY